MEVKQLNGLIRKSRGYVYVMWVNKVFSWPKFELNCYLLDEIETD